MRIFCNGFNLYNQLNCVENCIVEFRPTIDIDFVDFVKLQHSFLVIHSQGRIKVFCKLLLNGYMEYEKLKIVQISSNDKIILVLDDSGQLFKTPIDHLGHFELLPKFTSGDDKIRFISCGSKLNVAYTDSGMLYSIPEKVPFSNPDIVAMQTGQEHCILLDKLGNVYTFGRGSRGQLGHGQLDDESSPRLVEAVAGIKIVEIAAGGWHSAAVSQDGDLYTWGWNGNGQLGLSTSSREQEKTVGIMATPHITDIQDCPENNIIKLSCGTKHTIVLLDNNGLYGCGWNKYKQLKNEEQENYYSFVFLYDFSSESVKDITCGPWNSLSSLFLNTKNILHRKHKSETHKHLKQCFCKILNLRTEQPPGFNLR